MEFITPTGKRFEKPTFLQKKKNHIETKRLQPQINTEATEWTL